MRNIITIIICLCFSITAICQVADTNNAPQTETTNALVQDDTESPDGENADTVTQETGNAQDELTEQNTTGYVGTRTNSSSGSPAIPASEGENDGTNTRQRASLNIAGSEVPGGDNTNTVKAENTGEGKVAARKSENKKDENKESRSENKKRKKK